jgi:hypothetical protein
LTAQLLVESLLLTLAGGALGVLLAFGGLAALVRWLPHGTFPPEADIRVQIPVLLLSAFIIALTGVVSGLAPALRFFDSAFERTVAGSGQTDHVDGGEQANPERVGRVAGGPNGGAAGGRGAAVRSLTNLYTPTSVTIRKVC